MSSVALAPPRRVLADVVPGGAVRDIALVAGSAAFVGLAAQVSAAVDRALDQLRATDPATVLDERKVGRAGLPSTVIGCLFHGAEHSARHAGQFLSTISAGRR